MIKLILKMKESHVFGKNYINIFKFCKSRFFEEGVLFNIENEWVSTSYYNDINSESNLLRKLREIKKIKIKGGNSVFLPFQLTEDLLYIVGVVAGDGSLPVKYNGSGYRNYKISIQMKNYVYLRYIASLFKKVFNINPNFTVQKKGNRKYLEMYIYSKLIYKFFSVMFGIPEGKKSSLVRMPLIIRNLSSSERLPFVAGVVDTDWGKAGNSFGTHSASLLLIKDITQTISGVAKINFSPIRRYIQRNKYKSYQVRISKRDFTRFFELFKEYYPLKNQDKIIYLCRGNSLPGFGKPTEGRTANAPELVGDT